MARAGRVQRTVRSEDLVVRLLAMLLDVPAVFTEKVHQVRVHSLAPVSVAGEVPVEAAVLVDKNGVRRRVLVPRTRVRVLGAVRAVLVPDRIRGVLRPVRAVFIPNGVAVIRAAAEASQIDVVRTVVDVEVQVLGLRAGGKEKGKGQKACQVVNFQRFSTLDARKLVNGPKMSAHHRGICHF